MATHLKLRYLIYQIQGVEIQPQERNNEDFVFLDWFLQMEILLQIASRLTRFAAS